MTTLNNLEDPRMAATTTVDEVKAVVVEILGIEERAETLDSTSPLLGSIPELDSMAVLELVTALEDRFGFEVDEAQITGDVFETLGSLAAMVDEKRG